MVTVPDEKETHKLSKEELESQQGRELPDREAMSILPIGDPSGVGAPMPIDDFDGPPPDPGPERQPTV